MPRKNRRPKPSIDERFHESLVGVGRQGSEGPSPVPSFSTVAGSEQEGVDRYSGFNLSGGDDESVFISQPVTRGELPWVTNEALRTFINDVVLCRRTDPSILKKLTMGEMVKGFREGINRWHRPPNHGKER